MHLRRVLVVLVFGLATTLTVHATVDPSLYQDLSWRSIGPFRGGRVLAVAGIAGDGRRRAHLAADFRFAAGRLDRGAGAGAVGPEDDLRGQWRDGHALGHRAWQRHVQERRRRRALVAYRTRRHATERPGAGRAARPERGVRGGARPRLRAERRTRRVPFHRWRRALEQGAVQGR